MEDNETYTPPIRRRRRKKKQTVLTAAPLLVCILAIGVVYLLTGCFGLNSGTANRPTAPETDAAAPSTPALSTDPAESEAPTSDTSETDALPTDDTEEPAPEDTTEPTTEATEPAPLSFTTVGEEYFDDALFIGDSRTNGLEIYDPPSDGADFYCGTSMTIFGVLDSSESVGGVTGFANVLQAKQYGKIYIMFGINECGYDTGVFIESFQKVVDQVRAYQPDAIIYLQSILYVTQAKENEMPVFASTNLDEKNAEIAKLANGRDIFYLEVNDALNDGTNHLPADYTGDGVHLKASCYKYWKDYLYQHAIVVKTAAAPTPKPST